MKKTENLDLCEWQNYLDRFKADKKNLSSPPIAMRIENTMLTTARYAGGCRFQNELYTYFEPQIPNHEPNPDGTPYVAWLLVRDDFLRWVSKELKKESKEAKDEDKVEQPSLL